MPPPTGVVSGPLMPIRYSRNVSTVSSGSQEPVASNAFCPASTSFQAIDLPCLAAAASITSCAAGQMSTPVPSPSTNGMIGSSGTVSTPSDIVILSAMAEKAIGLAGSRSLRPAKLRPRSLGRSRQFATPPPALRSRPRCLSVEGCSEGAHEGGGFVGTAAVEEAAHQGAADDHAVAEGRGLRGLVRGRDADAQQHGSIGHGLAAPAHLLGVLGQRA